MKVGISFLRKSFIFLFALLIASCAEQAGTGAKVDLTYVVIECKTLSCRNFGFRANAIVKITSSSCDPVFDHWAAASTSMEVQCNSIAGCTGSSANWVDGLGQAITQLPSGSYTVCGLIDFKNNYPVTTDDDATIEIQSFRVDGVTPIKLTNWIDP